MCLRKYTFGSGHRKGERDSESVECLCLVCLYEIVNIEFVAPIKVYGLCGCANGEQVYKNRCEKMIIKYNNRNCIEVPEEVVLCEPHSAMLFRSILFYSILFCVGFGWVGLLPCNSIQQPTKNLPFISKNDKNGAQIG